MKGKPIKLSGITLKGFTIDIHNFLIGNGYKKHKIKEKGYIRFFDKTHRFHAYITGEDRLQIHTDVFSENGLVYGSKFKVKEEIHRLALIRHKIQIKNDIINL